MKSKLAIFILIFTCFQFAKAQDEDNRTAVGLYLIKAEYRGDFGSSLWNFNANFNLGGSVSVQEYLSPSFDLGLTSSYSKYNYLSHFTGRKFEVAAFTNFKLNNGLIFNRKSLISPFLTGGIGIAGYNAGIPNDKGVDFILPLGAGFKIQLTENIGLEYKYLVNFTNNDTRDGKSVVNGRNDIYGQHFAGLVISFGGKDSDKDGVKESKDLCPNTPLGLSVDKNGCPLDTDNDGVPDYLDECPNVPGLKLFNGCPDGDNDGVPDNKDQCPNTPEGVKVNRNGCPKDFDGDGTPDYLDKCAEISGPAKFNGCPDSDGDGIPDNLDKCPGVAGSPSNDGCPIIKNDTVKVAEFVLPVIHFKIADGCIDSESKPLLNEVAEYMRNHVACSLEIIGYTDNQGNERFNEILSQKRAMAVMAYLTTAGVSAQKLTVKGLGDMNPIADNNTKEGRLKNRRVEFFTKY